MAVEIQDAEHAFTQGIYKMLQQGLQALDLPAQPLSQLSITRENSSARYNKTVSQNGVDGRGTVAVFITPNKIIINGDETEKLNSSEAQQQFDIVHEIAHFIAYKATEMSDKLNGYQLTLGKYNTYFVGLNEGLAQSFANFATHMDYPERQNELYKQYTLFFSHLTHRLATLRGISFEEAQPELLKNMLSKETSGSLIVSILKGMANTEEEFTHALTLIGIFGTEFITSSLIGTDREPQIKTVDRTREICTYFSPDEKLLQKYPGEDIQNIRKQLFRDIMNTVPDAVQADVCMLPTIAQEILFTSTPEPLEKFFPPRTRNFFWQRRAAA